MSCENLDSNFMVADVTVIISNKGNSVLCKKIFTCIGVVATCILNRVTSLLLVKIQQASPVRLVPILQ